MNTQDILVIGLVVLAAIALWKLPEILRIVGGLIDPQVVKDLIPSLAGLILQQTTQTQTTLDETLMISALQRAGYTVTKDDAGYHVTPNTTITTSGPISISAAPPSDATTITHTLSSPTTITPTQG